MPRVINPSRMLPPPPRHTHAIVHSARAHRLVIAAQMGLRPDGSLAEGLEAQMLAAWDNIHTILREAGMAVSDLIRVCVFVTVPGSVLVHRSVLEGALGGHAAGINYLEVSALSQPDFLVAIEAEAVSEVGDGIYDDMPATRSATASQGFAR